MCVAERCKQEAGTSSQLWGRAEGEGVGSGARDSDWVFDVCVAR